MTAEEREVMVELRIALARQVRSCPGCAGSGRLPSLRGCPLCRAARSALDRSEQLLLPTCEATEAVDT